MKSTHPTVDLDPLEPELLQLLEQARQRDAEDPADEPGARLCLARVEAAVRIASTNSAPGLARSLPRWPYAAVTVVALGALFAAKRSASENEAPPRASIVARSMSTTSASRAEPTSEPNIPTLRIDELPSARTASPRSAGPLPPTTVAATPSSEPGSTLADELRLIERARSALSAHDPETALQLAREHEHRFAIGQLVQERERIYVQSLAESGRADEARARSDAFRARFPSGLLRQSVEHVTPDARP